MSSNSNRLNSCNYLLCFVVFQKQWMQSDARFRMHITSATTTTREASAGTHRPTSRHARVVVASASTSNTAPSTLTRTAEVSDESPLTRLAGRARHSD